MKARRGGDHYEAAPPSPVQEHDEKPKLTPQHQPPTQTSHKPSRREILLEGYAQQKPLSERENPLSRASLLSVLSAHWIQPLISLGAAKVLELQDLWPVAVEDTCDEVCKRFMQEYRPPQRIHSATNSDDRQQQTKPFSPVISAFFRTFKRDIALVLANFVVFTLALALQAYIAQAMLDFLSDRENIFNIDNGYVLVVMMTLASLLAVTCSNHGFHVCSRFGVNVRSVIMDLIYQKSLRLSSGARQAYTMGEIVTLMSVDAERIFNCMTEGFWIFISPFGFIVTIVLIAFLFDAWSALCGAILLVLILYASYRQASRIGALQAKLLSAVDERIKVTSEALQGIRVMKFYAWEASIARRIEKIRNVEVSLYRKFHTLQILNIALLFLTPTLLSGVTFGVYILMHGEVSVTDAFTLIAMVNVCRAAVGMFPRAIATVSQARIAIARVDAFLESEELPVRRRVEGTEKTVREPIGSISVRDASFQWSQPEPGGGVVVVNDTSTEVVAQPIETTSFRLESVNIEIDAGSLVMIVGKVGSGKSSLLNALLGEMVLVNGQVDVNGEVAYVTQESWIRNSTVKDNILFEDALDADRYQEVLEATQLALDLHALPNGDQTEIGERGINLSGGQKARVAIARAMYRSQYDILILDDPLSAVDPHVAHAIFDQCIAGLAKQKTRMLVLNSHYDLLAHADKVLVVQDGHIVGDGTYKEVLAQFSALGIQSEALDKLERNVIDEHDGITKDEHQHEAVVAIAIAAKERDQGATDASASLPTKQKPDEIDGDSDKLIQDEDRVKGKVTGQIYKNYFDEAGLNGVFVLVVLIVVYSASQGIRTLVDWWQGHWAKNMVRDGVDPSFSNLKFGTWYLGFIVLCCIATVARGLLLVEACIRSSRNLHNELLQRVLSAPINLYFDVTPVGRILNRFSNDLDQVDTSLPQQYQMVFQNLALCVGAFAVSAASSYWIGVSYIPMMIAFVAVGRYFQKTSREVKRLEGITRTPVYNLFGETLTGLHTIRAFNMQDKFVRLNKQAVDVNATVYFTYWCTGRWLAVRLDLISVVIICIISLYLVATKGQISAVVSGISLSYSLMLTSIVQGTVRYADRLDNTMTSVERLLHFRTIPSEDDSISSVSINTQLWPSQGAIKFDNLCLKYRPELPLVLRGVNMDIQGGEKVGICGRTGAGKSSLMIALFRICEFDSGSVLIDGLDIQSVKLRDLRRSLAIIPQDPVLYSGSLRDNLDPFGFCSDDAIWSVLKQVHLFDSVTKWRAGLDYTVSERGDNLSVGQRQLMCIARALLKDSKIVVLDEATANVDTATDNLIQVTIKETFVSKTVLIIAHRINTIMHCDKIAVMDAGQVAEFGSPGDLLSQPESIFASLAKRSSQA